MTRRQARWVVRAGLFGASLAGVSLDEAEIARAQTTLLAPGVVRGEAADAQAPERPSSAEAAGPAAGGPGGLRPDDALASALATSPSLRAAVLDAVAARAATRAAEDARAPVLTANASGAFTESFTGTAAGVVRNDNRTLGAGVGLAWTSDVGTVLGLDLTSGATWRTVNRDPSTTTSFTIGPNYTGSLALSARQPMLRGAGRDAVRATEREALASEQQSLEQRDAQASVLVRDVLVAYWELWYAERALAVEREGLALATRQMEDARARVALGSLSNAEGLQFASSLASARETERAARATRARQALELTRLAGLEGAVTYADDPTPPALPRVDELAGRAAARSPELRSLAAGVEAARQRWLAARDTARARLDFVGRAGLVTLWADDTLAGLQLPDGRPGVVVSGGVELELPVGSSAAEARTAQAHAQLLAAEARLEVGRRDLSASLRAAFERAGGARDRVALATEAAAVAEQLAEAERQRLALGTTTPAEVVTVQQRAREAELRRLRAVVDAVTSAHRLEDAAGVLLDRFALRRAIEEATAGAREASARVAGGAR